MKIYKRVGKNRETVYLFLAQLTSNSTRKARRLGFYIVFMFAISPPLVPCAAAIVMLLSPVAIDSLSPIEESKNTGETPCIMFFNRETRQIALFNKTSGDLIRADKFRQNYFTKCIDSGQIGKGKPTN